MRLETILVLSLFVKVCFGQVYYESDDWTNILTEIESPDTIISFSNVNSNCLSNTGGQPNRVVLLYADSGYWYSATLKKDSIKHWRITEINPINPILEEFIRGEIEELKSLLKSISEAKFEMMSSSFFQFYFKQGELRIMDDYESGNINRFIGSKYELIFLYYAVCKNECD